MSQPLAPFLSEAPLVLASTSRYRVAQLSRLGLPFSAVSPPVDEASVVASDPVATIAARALAKAESARGVAGCEAAWIIGADQGVVLQTPGQAAELLGKPGNEEAAVHQLMRLAGRAHALVTAVCLSLPSGEALQASERVTICMWAFSEQHARAVVRRDRSWDCAGSYKIEASGPLLMERIEGQDPTAIEGLPLLALGRLLRQAQGRRPRPSGP